MNPGLLRHKITIQQKDNTKNDYGEPNGEWEDVYANTWAKIAHLSGKQLWEAEKVNSKITHEVIIRYKAGIKSSMKVIFGDRYFEIMYSLNPNERNEYLKLMCKEIN